MREFVGWLMIVAACGGDGAKAVDAAVILPDVAVDGPADARVDAPAGTVTLTIVRGGEGLGTTAPNKGVPVYFQNPDSSVASMTVTDDNGVATGLVEVGGFVTAINPRRSTVIIDEDLVTFAGVQPGDQLQLLNLTVGCLFGLPVTITVVIPLDPNATKYFLHTNEGNFDINNGSGQSRTVTVCAKTTDFVVEAQDANGVWISSLHHPAVTPVADGTVDLTGDTFVATPDATWTYTNVPAGITNITIENMLSNDPVRPVLVTPFGVTPSGGGATITRKRPILAGMTSTEVSLLGNGVTTQYVVDWGAENATYSLDVGSAMLPTITAASFDVAAHALTWTEGATGVAPDLTHAFAAFSRNGFDWAWTIVAHGAGTLGFPVLPDPDTRFNPAAGEFRSVLLAIAKVPGGYDAVRANGIRLGRPPIDPPPFLPAIVQTGATGHAVFNFLQQ